MNKEEIRDIFYHDATYSLRISPLSLEHAELISKAITDSIECLKPFMDWSHKEQSIESQIVRIKELQHNFHAGLEYDFSVFDQKTNEFLLSASLAASADFSPSTINIFAVGNFAKRPTL
ncbi:MAG: hypothetical protein ACSNEK_01430 [Parachlamydiaceae bacterium]